jgi:hypothetical protein
MGRKAEIPAPGLANDEDFVGIGVDTRCRKDAAIVGAARPRTMFVDRATAVDEHGAMPSLVVTEQDVTSR